MRHPALARVFAVVLVIMCLLLGVNGAVGFGKADAEYAERRAFGDKYAGRIENYRNLDEKVANSVSYDEASRQLEKLLEEHDDAASQHRIDTALYTAEKGGNTMGANLIWEYIPQVKEARMEMEKARAQFDGVEQAYAAVKDDIAQISAEAGSDAAEGNTELASLRAAISRFAALLQSEPQLPEDFVLPENPGEDPYKPEAPTLEEPPEPECERPGEAPEDPGEDADEETIAAWQAAMADYEAAQKAWAEYDAAKAEYDLAWETYRQALADFESYPERKAAYDKALARQEAYESEHAAWEEEVTEAVQTFPLEESMSVFDQLASDLEILGSRTNEVVNTFRSISSSYDGADLGNMDLGGMDLSALQKLSTLADLNPSEMTAEELINAASMVEDALGSLTGYFGDVTSPFEAIDKVFADARSLMDKAEGALKKAEGEMRTQLENIWYNLGELEKDKEKLEEEKQKLDEESVLLNKRVMDTDELKALKNRHISARQLLINIPEVKRDAAESGDIAASAQRYLEEYNLETERLLNGKRLVNLLAVIGAAAGLIGIPAAFEKTKSRILLILPVLLCFGCAAAADGINMSLGLGQMYTALFTAIFAAIQLLIILPKKKQIV